MNSLRRQEMRQTRISHLLRGRDNHLGSAERMDVTPVTQVIQRGPSGTSDFTRNIVASAIGLHPADNRAHFADVVSVKAHHRPHPAWTPAANDPESTRGFAVDRVKGRVGMQLCER